MLLEAGFFYKDHVIYKWKNIEIYKYTEVNSWMEIFLAV